MSAPLELPRPYLLFIGDVSDPGYAKTAFGLRDWTPEHCVGEWSLPGNPLRLGLAQLTPADAHARGARALVVGVAPVGGLLQPHWVGALQEALEAGLDLVSGMHTRLAEVPALAEAARRLGRRLIDVRVPPPGLPVASGRRRSGRRLLTVGTDCALGKKYTALALAGAFHRRGVAADFRATGQTGIMIAGRGIPIDAVVSDFVAGAAEVLSPDAAPDHWDVIEGQGSLFHPAYAGVSLGLLHGSQPDVLVLCHEPGRSHVLGFGEAFPLPSLEEAMDLHLRHARRVNAQARFGGVSLNTARLSAEAADALLSAQSLRLGLPCADPLRGGPAFERLVAACLAGSPVQAPL